MRPFTQIGLVGGLRSTIASVVAMTATSGRSPESHHPRLPGPLRSCAAAWKPENDEKQGCGRRQPQRQRYWTNRDFRCAAEHHEVRPPSQHRDQEQKAQCRCERREHRTEKRAANPAGRNCQQEHEDTEHEVTEPEMDAWGNVRAVAANAAAWPIRYGIKTRMRVAPTRCASIDAG